MSNSTVVYNALMQAGLTSNQAVGVVGNLLGESGMKPTELGDNNTSAGIAQWHNGRWTNLKRFAAQRGKSWTDLNTQIAFLISEMKSDGVWKKVTRQSTVDGTVTVMVRDYERPKYPAADIRVREKLASKFAKTIGSSSSSSSSGGTDSDTTGTLGSAGVGSLAGPTDGTDTGTADSGTSATNASFIGLPSDLKPMLWKLTFLLLGVGLTGAGAFHAFGAQVPRLVPNV